MPWFKNIIIYEFKDKTHLNKTELEKALNTRVFKACHHQEMSRLGWVSPYGDNNSHLITAIDDQFLLKARKESKLLPASVINDALHVKINTLEHAENRQLNKTEKASLKEDVIIELLPRAFSKYQHYWLWIDLKHQRVMLDTPSHRQAEDIISLLRNCLGKLPLAAKSHDIPIELLLTKWVKDNHQFPPFDIGDEAELKDPLNGPSIIHCKQQELLCNEIIQHIHAGKQITKLKLIAHPNLSFILNHDFSIKRIKYDTALLNNSNEIDNRDTEKKLTANFSIITHTLSDTFNKINEIVNQLSVK